MPFVMLDRNNQITEILDGFQPGAIWLNADDPLVLAFRPPPPRLDIVMPDTSPTTLAADPQGEMDATTRRFVENYVDEAIERAFAARR